MSRQGLFDTDAVPWGWFDVCGQDQGWFDRDLLFYPLQSPQPWYASLLYTGGWDETSDEFYASTETVVSAEQLTWHLGGWEEDQVLGKTLFGVDDRELEARVAWELGIEPYSRQVTFKDFESKILEAQRAVEKRAEFSQTMATISAESAEERQMALIKRTITLAGVTYIVWKVIVWL
jgi:hypothetical protein